MRSKGEQKRDHLPLNQEVEQELARRISAGEVSPGSKLPPELELASEFGVSRTTIRHALISLENQGLVKRLHGRGTFVQDETKAPFTAQGRKGGIYAIVPHLTSSFTGTIITGAQEVLFKKGHNLSVLPTNDSMAKERDYLQMLMESGAAGVLLHPTKSEYYNPYVPQLLAKGIPLVMTGRYYRFVDCSYVDSHNYQGAYDAITHLIGLGHRKVGLVTKKTLIHTSLEDRIQGYQDAMADHNLPLDRRSILLDLPDNRAVYWESANEEEERAVVNCLVDYLKASPEMTAVFALNDRIAADLMKAAKQCGLVIGRDLSIIGFDNVALSASLDPPLTTVDGPTMAIGKRAAEVLLNQMADKEAKLTKEHLPMQLVVRNSCGPNRRV